MNDIDQLARHLQQIHPAESWDWDDAGGTEGNAHHMHAAQQIRSYERDHEALFVEVVEPDEIDNDGVHIYSDGSAATDIRVHPGDGVGYQGGWEWTANQMRDVGLRWLAAAEASEQRPVDVAS